METGKKEYHADAKVTALPIEKVEKAMAGKKEQRKEENTDRDDDQSTVDIGRWNWNWNLAGNHHSLQGYFHREFVCQPVRQIPSSNLRSMRSSNYRALFIF